MSSEASQGVIDELMRGVHRALVARAFVQLSLPDYLGERPLAVADLALAVNADPGPLARLLRAAAATGLCTGSTDGYVVTPVGRELRSDSPGNAAGWLLLTTAPWTVRAWERLAIAVQSGQPPFSEVHGMGFWEYVADHPADAEIFDAAMTSGSAARAEDLLAAIDWSPVGVVVDVGGGQGRLAASLLAQIPHLRAIVADRPEVIADPVPAAPAVVKRLDLVACDFFEQIPNGGDVYVLSRILHDWPDAAALEILQRCRAAMTSDARLCVLEQVVPELAELTQVEQFDLTVKDLNMLVLVGGRERTLSEYTELYAAADLELQSVTAGNACDIMQLRPARSRI